MTPHKQLFHHRPDDDTIGDCYRTAVGCLLDLRPDEVPHFVDGVWNDAAAVRKRLLAWLETRGLSYVEAVYAAPLADVLRHIAAINPDTYYLLGGNSATGCGHVVVAINDAIVWDPSMTVAVLFARTDSIYKTLPGTDVYDIDRDARKWHGGSPVVAHPPCRAWGRLKHLAKPRIDERALGPFAVDCVRTWGGVVEHPAFSDLWLYCALPAPGHLDTFGGFTLPVLQSWWGHRAAKATWFYIVGCGRRMVPDMPIRLGASTHVVTQCRTIGGSRLKKGMPGWRPECSKNEREHTPPALAEWLVELARRCALSERLAA